jgi:ABC-type transporter Mla subunit MlaD
VTENTEADAIMALHKQVLVETGWECSTDSPPALKRAADTFRAAVEQLERMYENTFANMERARAERDALLERAERAERDNEALRSLLKEARECLDVATARPISVPAVLALLARIDDALAK